MTMPAPERISGTYGGPDDSPEGWAYPVLFPLSQPAAGADWIFKGPTAGPWVIDAIRCVLTCSAVVANRLPIFNAIGPNGQVLWSLSAAAALVASQATVFSLARGMGGPQVGGLVEAYGLPRFLLPPGSSIASGTLGLDVGDQWSQVIVTSQVPI